MWFQKFRTIEDVWLNMFSCIRYNSCYRKGWESSLGNNSQPSCMTEGSAMCVKDGKGMWMREVIHVISGRKILVKAKMSLNSSNSCYRNRKNELLVVIIK